VLKTKTFDLNKFAEDIRRFELGRRLQSFFIHPIPSNITQLTILSQYHMPHKHIKASCQFIVKNANVWGPKVKRMLCVKSQERFRYSSTLTVTKSEEELEQQATSINVNSLTFP
jgi:hypothetical protein